MRQLLYRSQMLLF